MISTITGAFVVLVSVAVLSLGVASKISPFALLCVQIALGLLLIKESLEEKKIRKENLGKKDDQVRAMRELSLC